MLLNKYKRKGMITLKTLVLAKAEDALLAIYDYCGQDCNNCVFDSCVANRAYNLHAELISGIAHSFGILDNKQFRIKHIGTRTVTEAIEDARFVLYNGNIYIHNGSGDTFNSILDLLLEGTYEVVLID